MLAQGEKAALQFSGGKDSLALLHLSRPHLDNITVFFGDTGSTYPHVKQFVIDTCKELGASLVMVEPFMPVQEFTEQYGFPSDLVSTDRAPEARWMNEEAETKLQSYVSCCGNMIWLPMQAAIKARGIKIILRGSKGSDPHVTVPDGHKDENFEYRSPLWGWTDKDVMRFLEDKDMPDQYPEIMDSMDCWICTAHMTGKYARQKLEYAREKYPTLWPEISRRVRIVRDAVSADLSRVNHAFEVVT